MLNISIVIPFYNEEKSLPVLCNRTADVLQRLGKTFEIILIDDGSEDGSYEQATALQEANPCVKSIKLRSNSGKARALAEGFRIACGRIVFTMDADLQDDPEEIPKFLEKLDEGFDLVTGWKKRRFDPLEKRVPSKFFNHMTSIATGLRLHDFNCGFKAYRREVLEEIKVYGALHRYIPALAHWRGFRVGELPVNHRPRPFGRSKYGWRRYLEGFFDFFTVILLTRFNRTPLYLFGGAGMLISLAGLAILLFITGLQVVHGSILGHKPLSFLGILDILLGSQLIATGLIAQMLSIMKDGYEPDRPGRSTGRRKNVFRLLLDILSCILMTNFNARPLHLFGLIGLVIGTSGFLINLGIAALKFLTGDTGGHYTLLLMGVTLMVLGFQWFSTGLLGEIINNLQQRAKDRKHVGIIHE